MPPSPSVDARDALRTRIAETVARAGVFPVARRTIELLLEAATEPSPDVLGYRVIDRAGKPRLDADSGAPLDLDGLIAELRGLHPALFVPPAPEPQPEPEPAVPPADTTADIKAATVRFVDAQAVRARSFMARSATRGQAMAASVSEAWTQLRLRRAAPVASSEATPPAEPAMPINAVTPDPVAGRERGTRMRETARDAALHARGRLADTASRLRDLVRDRNVLRDALDRRALAIGLGALVVVTIAAVLTGRGGDGEGTGAPSEIQAPTSASPTGSGSAGNAAQDTSPAPAEEPPKPAQGNELAGPVEVIDTATLRVAGKLVRLFGVEWVRGGQADELTRYLAGRSVVCQPVAGSEARLCTVDGRDLSEVVLFNGGGRASSEATPDLVAAEDHARSERLGVWSR